MAVLDHTKKQDVVYCIPLWLRDEQVRVNTANVKGRISPNWEQSDEPIAIVCYGPSLQDTWEEIKGFKRIMTCSGAHRFLIDKGIIPTWHVEVDPREHKVKLVGEPHPDVEYLIASTCHPKYFEHLKGRNVKLWHVFDPGDEGIRLLPHGEWAITGGCGAGLRAMTLARFLGFKDQHIFGMDGSEGASGKHAGSHPNQAKDHHVVTVGGREFRTTPAFLEAARGTFHELNAMPDVHATFHGDGLVQQMSKEYVRHVVAKPMIGFEKPTLISPKYRDLNVELHRDNLAYGVGGGRHADTILKLAQSIKSTSVLDYGCGKGYLAKALPFPIWEYDPAIPEKSVAPRPADLVACTDVLEHVEPDHLKYVLKDLKRCTLKLGYFVIHTGPSKKTLSDGRNSHLIQEGESWWRKKLEKHFVVGKIIKAGPELHAVVSPKGGTNVG